MSAAISSHVSFEGRINIYTCAKCHDHIVTIDRTVGVTPFTIKCPTNLLCHGVAYSCCYRVNQSLRPRWEWYKPDSAELATLGLQSSHHVSQGGLLLRPIIRSQRFRQFYEAKINLDAAPPIYGESLVRKHTPTILRLQRIRDHLLRILGRQS